MSAPRPPPPTNPSRLGVVRAGLFVLAAAGLACGTHPLAQGLPAEVACNSCHGSADNDAPPRPAALDKTLGTESVHVGAHQLHVRDGLVRKRLECDACHPVPKTVDEPGHVAPGPARLRWGPLAAAHGTTPAWDREAATCANVYCHGATLTGGDETRPRWTFETVPEGMVTLSEKSCRGCHGFPPPAPHPQDRRCSRCHSGTVRPDGSIDLEGGLHVDGRLQLDTFACNVCHGSEANPAPPLDTSGLSDTSLRSVGAHQQHLADSPVRKAIACTECHRVPLAFDDPGHADGAPQLVFGPLASAQGVQPAWDAAALTCTVYCHGATLAGGAAARPLWTRVDGAQVQCDGCHGAPPPAPHPQNPACSRCHPGTVRPDGSIDLAAGLHLDGAVQLATECTACHGGPQGAAPPADLSGNASSTARGVGAHQAHLTDGPLRKAIACRECHLVPAVRDAPGHLDHPPPARLTWGPLASAGGVQPSFDPQALTCAVYCHGATLAGGAATAPRWTLVDGSQVACGGCHGAPPPAPHPQRSQCALCHPGTVKLDGTIDVAGGQHLDGAVQSVGDACTACHGTAGQNAAPPRDLAGRTATSQVTVGAHQAHLRTDSAWHRPVRCADCHAVPAKLDDPGHLDHPLPARLTWSALASAKGSAPAWDRAAGTCANVYCHGAKTRGGTTPAPAWTGGPSQAGCGACHGAPPAGHYGDRCSWCHPTMNGGVEDGFADPARHLDGTLDVSFGPCGSCHAVPPATGAHLAHVGEPDATRAAFALEYGDLRSAEQFAGASGDRTLYGCGNCHPTDPARHMDGLLQVELSPAGLPPGALRARNDASAAYDAQARTCSGVYCHSSGQAETFDGASPPQRLTPGFAATPAWDGGAPTTCTSCHQNPPRYPSGGAGAPTANGHLQFSPASGWDEGHFRGVAHDWHGAPGGGASAVTCQTCHFATVDARNTAAPNLARDASRPFASGFYYLDTTGDYVVGAQGSARWRCQACHTGQPGQPAAGAGKVRPLLHANGRRDVVFDDRQTVVDYPFVAGQPNPQRPQWQAPFGTACEGHTPEVCGIWQQRSTFSGATWSFSLSNTFTDAAHPTSTPAYDPATKTCWYVGCHLGNPAPVWGGPMGTFANCTTCHAK